MVSVDEIKHVKEKIRANATKRYLRRRLKFLELTAPASLVNERYQIRSQTLATACKALTFAASGVVVILCIVMASDAIARFTVASSLAFAVIMAAREVGRRLDRFCDQSAWISVPLLKICEEHLEQPVKANEHYLAVCRALITEAVDLKSFLEKVSSTGESLKNFGNVNNNNGGLHDESQTEEFPTLNFTEWAHLWIQVVSDLRFGVKLKKVEGYARNVEYELTPYEILMEDIRQRNYLLKKVAVGGEPPQRVNRDAHDIILDFIKSRPTLKPSEDRMLPPPPPRSKSLHELLLEQIQGPPSPLRHVKLPAESALVSRLNVEERQITASRSCNDILNDKSHRRTRLNAPPFAAELGVAVSTSSFLESDSDESYDEDSSSFAVDSMATEDLSSTTIHDDSISSFKRHNAYTDPCSLRSSGTSGVSSGGGEDQDPASLARPGSLARSAPTARKKKVLSVELPPSPVLGPDDPDSSFDDIFPLADARSYEKYPTRAGVRRAHSTATASHERKLTWRERRALLVPKSSAVDFLPPERSLPLPPSVGASSPVAKRDRREEMYSHDHSSPLRRTMSDRRAFNPLRVQNRWNHADECVKVTTKELIALREKLVAHDLEKYQGRGEFYTNLRKGKICFNCRVREFSIFWWARTCDICKQKTCSKCMRKVEAPIDQSLQAPVYDLCPSLSPDASTNKQFFARNDHRTSSTRYPVDSRFSVLGVHNEPSLVDDQRVFDTRRFAKSQKMDVCESCRDLISRALYMTTMYPPTRETRPAAPEFKRYVLGRPISVSDRLRRSATFMTSQSSPPFGRKVNVGASRSVQGLQTAAE